MELKEAKKKRVCRICHQEALAKGPGDPFVFDFGKEHAHQSCLDWENESGKKIEEKELEPIKIEHLQKEIDAMELHRSQVTSELYSKKTMLAMWDGQIKIRKRFIETLKKIQDGNESLKAIERVNFNTLVYIAKHFGVEDVDSKPSTHLERGIRDKFDELRKRTKELQERHDLLIEEIKRITGCKEEDIEFHLGMPGQVRKPIINVKMGEEKRKRFDLEDDIAKFVALLNWAKDRNKNMSSKYDESVELIAKYRELADRILYEEKENQNKGGENGQEKEG